MIVYRPHPYWLARSANVLAKIYAHPFNQQLCAGTLPRATFKFYLEQDALYLRDYAKALRIISKRFSERNYAAQFRLLAEEMVSAELNLHFKYLRKAEQRGFFSQPKHPPIQKIPVISAYTEHLLYTAHTAPLPVAVTSCVPCPYIYFKLGEQMKAHCPSNNPNSEWIATYSSQQFTASTQFIMQTTNELTSRVDCPMLKKRISYSFLQSATFELMFFDAALAGSALHTKMHNPISMH